MYTQSILNQFYPTTVVMVDDNERFLKTLQLQLDPNLPTKEFVNPVEAVEYIRQQQSKLGKTGFKQFNNQHKYHEPSVLVVDFAMPALDGGEVCRQLQDLPIKKILLTGQADENIAINLFNQGLIDKFIVKDNPEYDEILRQSIEELQNRYMLEKSEQSFEALPTDLLSKLKTPQAIYSFRETCVDLGVTEYFVLPLSGQILLKTRDQSEAIFMVTTDEEMNDFIEIATDNNASSLLMDLLSKKVVVPFYQTLTQLLSMNEDEWRKRVYPTRVYNTEEENMYITVIKHGAISHMIEQDIVEFDTLMAETA